jgi:hypothetical protein
MPQDTRDAAIQRIVRCERLSVCDKSGLERLAGFVDDGGVCRFNLLLPDGAPVLCLYATEHGEAGVYLLQKDKTRVQLDLNADGSAQLSLRGKANPGTGLHLWTQESGSSTAIAVGPAGTMETVYRTTDDGTELRIGPGGSGQLRIRSGKVAPPNVLIRDGVNNILWQEPK